MAKNSETLTKTGIQKVVGWYESKEITTVTDLVEGDIVGRTGTGVFGKLDAITYTAVYGIAYDASALGLDGTTKKCLVIIGGEINKAFVKLPTGEEHLTEILLRDKAIYLK